MQPKVTTTTATYIVHVVQYCKGGSLLHVVTHLDAAAVINSIPNS